jgi:hypothetical protein
MHTDKISESARKLLGLLSGKLPKDTYLAGGTGLTLHIGHRTSYDLDLYSPNEFSETALTTRLESQISGFKVISQDWQTVRAKYEDTEFSIFYYPYKLLEATTDISEVKLVSIIDIAAMKLEAIAGRGLKRDFFDIFKICQLTPLTLKELINANEEKYQRDGANLPHLLNSLVYFDDAEKLTERAKEVDAEWGQVKEFFIQQAKLLLAEFPQYKP